MSLQGQFFVLLAEVAGIPLLIGGIWGLITWKRDSYTEESLKMGLRASIIMVILGAWFTFCLIMRLSRWFTMD